MVWNGKTKTYKLKRSITSYTLEYTSDFLRGSTIHIYDIERDCIMPNYIWQTVFIFLHLTGRDGPYSDCSAWAFLSARKWYVKSKWNTSAAIDPYHSMSKQKILPVEPLIQCEAGRAKTMQRQNLYSPRTPKWPPHDKGEFHGIGPCKTMHNPNVIVWNTRELLIIITLLSHTAQY